jgi:hemerythrin-like domain-containing protein
LEYNSEPIPKMVERLRAEHRDFRLELIQIEEVSKFSSHKAIEILKGIGKSILRHEVEGEARIIRIIMENAKEFEQSVKVMEEHRVVIDLLENKISQFEDSSQEVAEQIKTFGEDMRRHFSEEEEIIFPLLLKAVSGGSVNPFY